MNDSPSTSFAIATGPVSLLVVVADVGDELAVAHAFERVDDAVVMLLGIKSHIVETHPPP